MAAGHTTPLDYGKHIEPVMRYFSLFAFLLAVAVPSPLVLAGVAPNSGASAMSQSGAKVAPAKPPVEDNKDQREEGKESAK